MKTKMKTKSALPWFGSAAGVSPQIGARFNGCKHMTIVFAGGLPELPYLTATHVVANDLHSFAHNFYQVASRNRGLQQ